jgi:hypothetical protein
VVEFTFGGAVIRIDISTNYNGCLRWNICMLMLSATVITIIAKFNQTKEDVS